MDNKNKIKNMNIFKRKNIDTISSVDGWKLSTISTGLKFRVKEYIFQFDSGEKHTFAPQMNIDTLEEGYTVDHVGPDMTSTGEGSSWVNLRRTGFETLKEAEEFCKTIKPKLDKRQIKFHYL